MNLVFRFRDKRELFQYCCLFLCFFGRINGLLYENDIVFVLLIALACAGIVLNFRQFIHQSKWYIVWVIGFLVLYIVSAFWAKDPHKTYINFVATAGRYILVLYIYSCIVDTKSLKMVVSTFVAAVALNDLILLVVYGPNVLLNHARLGGAKAGNGNIIGMSSACAMLLDYYINKDSKKGVSKKRFLLYILFLLLILLSGSKKAVFIVFFVFGFMYFLRHRNRLGALLVVAICAVLVYLAFMNIPFLYRTVGRRIVSLVDGLVSVFRMDKLTTSNIRSTALNTSDRTRMYMILNGLEWIKEKPVLGYGMANFSVLYRTLSASDFYAHNNAIEIGVGMGVVGLIWYYSLYVTILMRCFHSKKTTEIKISLTLIFLLLVLEVGLVSYLEIFAQLLLCIAYLIPNMKLREEETSDGT